MIIPKLAMKGGKEKNTIVGSGTIVNYLVYSFFFFYDDFLYIRNIFFRYIIFGMQTQYRHCLIQQNLYMLILTKNTAAFFSIFGVTRESYWFSLFSTGIIIFYYIIALRKSNVDIIYLKEYLVLIYCMLLSVVYMTLLSKDFIVLLIIFPFISFSRTNRGLLLWSFIALIYAYFFRTYWILIVSLFWGYI
ncbi:hypothetical protein BANRA_01604 [Klebsiella pneumoniae]|nr:hypothetical protein BANRA_01604 [Klebsiella pneumoniae]